MNFANLEQRMAQSYIDMFPAFIPEENLSGSADHSGGNAAPDKSEQKKFYNLIKNLYKLAFDEPLMFVSSLHEDDAYPRRFNRASYGKPDLEKNMKKFLKAVDDLLQNMYLAGHGSPINFSKKQQAILSKLGIEDYTALPAGWTWMARRPDANIITFSHCFFRKDYPYVSAIFAPLIGEAAFRKLEKWMNKKGYKSHVLLDITASNSRFSLTYANPAWSKEDPKGFLFKVKHTGVSLSYEPFVKSPPVLGLCVPNGLKPYLENFDSMDEKLKEFVTGRTKKCDACKYCVQTDKTGSRPLAAMNTKYGNKNYSLCPYFPGFSYCWSAIDDDLADKLTLFMSFMDGFAPEKP